MDIVKRKCKNCIYFPCLRIECNMEEGYYCDHHEFEHTKLGKLGKLGKIELGLLKEYTLIKKEYKKKK